jgi:hypothetical protein
MVTYLLTFGAFVLPVLAAVAAWKFWSDAKLSEGNLLQLEAFLQPVEGSILPKDSPTLPPR